MLCFQQDKVPVPADFLFHNAHNIRLDMGGFIKANDVRGSQIRFGRDNKGVFIRDGVVLAWKFKLNVPTQVKFTYLGPLNIFKVSFGHHVNDQVANNSNVPNETINIPDVVQQPVVMEKVDQEVIEISSDEEVHIDSDAEEEGPVVQNAPDLHVFVKRVSTAMARTDKQQVLVSHYL